MFDYVMRFDTIVFIFFAAIGTVAHFLKKCILEKVKFSEYWTKYPYNSALSLIGVTMGMGMLMSAGETSIWAYFSCGYMADSLFNKCKDVEV